MEYTNVIARIPTGEIGRAQLIHDTPSELTRMRAAWDGQPLYRDKYARLILNGEVMMTDAEFERRTNRAVLDKARGDVLIAGLGIGLILDPIIAKADSVTVVENSADVIALVGPYFPSCKIVEADILTWKPRRNQAFDVIYFDIWPDICEDDRTEAAKLHRRFSKHLKAGGYMESWCRIALRASHRRR